MSAYTINSEEEFENFKMKVVSNEMQGFPSSVIRDFLDKINLGGKSFPCYINSEIDRAGNPAFTFSETYRYDSELHFENECRITFNKGENKYTFSKTSLCKKGYDVQSKEVSSTSLSLDRVHTNYNLSQNSKFCKKEMKDDGSSIIKSDSTSYEHMYNAAGVEMFSTSVHKEYPDRKGTDLYPGSDNFIDKKTATTSRRASLLTFENSVEIYEGRTLTSREISGYRLKDPQCGIESLKRYYFLDNQDELSQSIAGDNSMSENDVRDCLAGTSPEASEFLLNTYYPYMTSSMSR